MEDEKSSEEPTHELVAESSQFEAAEADAPASTEDATPAEPAATHTTPDPFPAAALVEEPTDPEEHPSLPEAAVKGSFEPQQIQTEDSGLDNLAHATVTGLPVDTVGPAEVTEIPKAVLPPHTDPSQDFGKEGLLRIHLLEAQNLVAKDNLMGGMVKGKSDPYVKINIGQVAFKSHVIKENLNPTWNEMYEVVLSGHGNQEIKFEAFDKDLDADDFLGSCPVVGTSLWDLWWFWSRICLAEPELVLDQWFHLDGALPESHILLRAELKILESKMVDLISAGTLPCAAPGPGNGQVKLSLSYASQEKQLSVIVHACRGLLSQGKDGVDSYVSLMLLPDKSKATKRKTAVKKRDLNPEYNERFEYALPVDEAKFRRLSVSVKNNSASFRSRDVIGQVQIELAQLDLISGVTEWFTLKDEAD
ncbi:Extended synaptotagmin-1 [Larimichthys crocea]|uniref:Uncharacterized protein n=1 Tax=Larimichthys crocea TaxID=215358 RepID=A0ACD3RLF8_LARCR|nr:Extended synaptotagmin-1 [Larimichthys crocea]